MRKDKGTILLVDDEPKILASLSKILENYGFQTLTTTDGNEAVSTIEERDVDLVVLDLVMPEIDGITVLKRILEKSHLCLL